MNEQLNTPPHRQVIECIESWHDENGNWYRIYSDGFIEQGGIVPSQPSNVDGYEVKLLKPYTNTNYLLLGGNCSKVTNSTWSSQHTQVGYNKTTTSFYCCIAGKSVNPDGYQWYACGY